MQILAISGSLRAASANTSLLRVIAKLSPADVGDFAYASLTETLRMMSARQIERASLIIPFIRTKIDREGQLTDPPTEVALRAALNALIESVQYPLSDRC